MCFYFSITPPEWAACNGFQFDKLPNQIITNSTNPISTIQLIFLKIHWCSDEISFFVTP